MRKMRGIGGMLASILLACCTCASALDPSLDISQYAHTSWKIREGFTTGASNAIAQTSDGYLWLGTEFGLYRFDGVRAVPWHPPEGEHLPSDIIRSLFVARDGTLWISTQAGLASWKDGRLTTYDELKGRTVGTFVQDHEGTVWAGLFGPGEVCALRSGRAQCYGAGSFGEGVYALYEDSRHNLWVSAWMGLWRWAPGAPRRYNFPAGTTFSTSLAEADDGTLLLGTGQGTERLADGKIQSYSIPGLPRGIYPNFFRSSDGSLWIRTTQGLLRLHNDRIEKFSATDGLSGDFVTTMFEDREGSLWVGTEEGLDRFRELAVPRISRAEGLLSSTVYAVQATADGSIWMGTSLGLNRWQNGHMTGYRSVAKVADGEQPPARANTTEVANSGLKGAVAALGLDDDGHLWASASNGVFYLVKDRLLRVSGLPGEYTSAISNDGHGNVWVLNAFDGLFRVLSDRAVQRISSLQPISNEKRYWGVILPDRSEGALWVGSYDGGIVHFKDGQAHAFYTASDGLGVGRLYHLRLGSRGALWASTQSGLSRIKDGHIATLSSKNGLPCDTVHWSMEDDDHAVWLFMGCGLARITRSELDSWVSDSRHIVNTTVFDSSDGVRLRSLIGRGSGPQVTKSSDGRIWFATVDGVSIIDPHYLAFNKLPPPVHIEQVTADDKTVGISNGMHLPTGVHHLDIDYTALSLAIPEKVHFKVKLEGEDKDWRELVNVRHVEYTNLAPKHYRFRVLASNNSGVWNETGDSLDFTIPPAWYQTWWFRAACLAAFLLLLWAIYQRRVYEIEEQEKKFREAVETMPALAFVADTEGNRPFVNRGWLDYTGLSSEQASGQGWQQVIHPNDLKRVLEKWRAALASAHPLEYETRMRRGSDGVYRWFQTRARPLFDRRGKLVKWCAVATDIEDRKRAEQLQADLAHVNRVSTLGELAASISHELNQPIAAAIMNADLTLHWVEHDPPDLAQIRQRAKTIVEMGTLASKIIDRLRSLYKKEPPKRVALAVNEVIGEMAELLRGQAMRHGASLRTDLADDLPDVIADRVQVQQVLMNLLLNGIEAMSDTGGVLTVRSKLRDDGQIEISVIDTGPGLPLDKADQIFDAFFTTKPQGSGMGLAISKTIVESHGGRIWATGDAGHGATFHFTLPPASVEADIPVSVT